MGERRPTGKTVCQRQRGRGTCGSGRLRQLIQQGLLAGERQNRWAGPGNPGFEIPKGGQAHADGFGYAID